MSWIFLLLFFFFLCRFFLAFYSLRFIQSLVDFIGVDLFHLLYAIYSFDLSIVNSWISAVFIPLSLSLSCSLSRVPTWHNLSIQLSTRGNRAQNNAHTITKQHKNRYTHTINVIRNWHHKSERHSIALPYTNTLKSSGNSTTARY